MRSWNVLLLDAAGVNDSAKALLDAVAFSAVDRISIRYESLAAEARVSLDASLAGMFSRHEPDLMLVVFPPGPLSPGEPLVRRLRELRPASPVVAVVPECLPEDMMRLFAAGLSDYIAPPIRRVDILPRIWRLLGAPADPTEAIAPKRLASMRQLIGNSPRFLAEIEKFHG